MDKVARLAKVIKYVGEVFRRFFPDGVGDDD